MSFDFRYTCPEIDKNITYMTSDLQSVIKAMLDDVLEQIEESGGISEDTKKGIIKDYTEDGVNIVKSSFEEVRSLNEDMRDAANKQINDLIDLINEKDSEIEYLKQEVKELQQIVEDYEDKIDIL